jgi:hypothetical protein
MSIRSLIGEAKFFYKALFVNNMKRGENLKTKNLKT